MWFPDLTLSRMTMNIISLNLKKQVICFLRLLTCSDFLKGRRERSLSGDDKFKTGTESTLFSSERKRTGENKMGKNFFDTMHELREVIRKVSEEVPMRIREERVELVVFISFSRFSQKLFKCEQFSLHYLYSSMNFSSFHRKSQNFDLSSQRDRHLNS